MVIQRPKKFLDRFDMRAWWLWRKAKRLPGAATRMLTRGFFGLASGAWVPEGVPQEVAVTMEATAAGGAGYVAGTSFAAALRIGSR